MTQNKVIEPIKKADIIWAESIFLAKQKKIKERNPKSWRVKLQIEGVNQKLKARLMNNMNMNNNELFLIAKE